MKNLQMIAQECLEEMDAIGIEYGNIIEWKINTRAKKRWGQCKKVAGGFSINISNRLLEDYVSDKATKNTVVHEILHTVDGCFDHQKKWKQMADLVNDCYGYNVKTTTSAEEKGIKREMEDDPYKKYKYGIQCRKCNHIIYRTKKTKVTEHPNYYRCGRCNGSLLVFKL